MLAKDTFFTFGLNKRARINRSGNQNEQSRETGNIDEDKLSNNKTQYALDTSLRKQTQ